MIRVPFSLDDLDQMAATFFAKMDAQFEITSKLQHRPHDLFSDLFTQILAGLDNIMKGRPDVLETELNRLAPYVEQVKAAYQLAHPPLTASEVRTAMNTEVFRIFNYDYDHHGFTKRYTGRMAYDHAELFKLNCCPYCNAQFTFTIRKGGARTRPNFDHFYAKSTHPYFALSFYNLVPSCYVCNSSLKSSEPFLDSTHLHPFVAGFENLYEFRTHVDDADFVVNKNDFELKLAVCKNVDALMADKAQNSIKSFAINIRYENHKDIASELITKSYLYNYSTIRELLLGYKPGGHQLFSSENEILELLMSNLMDEDQMHRRIFSKLTRDICDEFHIGITLPKS